MEKRCVYIEFTRPSGLLIPWVSWAVRFAERTPFSHVRVVWYNSSDLKLIYEASGTQVHFIGEIAQKSNKVEVIDSFKIELTDEEYRKMIDLCMKMAGIKYGIKQLVGIFAVYLFSLTKNPFADGKYSQVCSELVARLLHQIKGWDTGVDFDTVGPRAIHNALRKMLQSNQPDITRDTISS